MQQIADAVGRQLGLSLPFAAPNLLCALTTFFLVPVSAWGKGIQSSLAFIIAASIGDIWSWFNRAGTRRGWLC
jgi:hypothetical protein